MKLVPSSLTAVAQAITFGLSTLSAAAAVAQGPVPRIVAPIDNTARTVLANSRPPRARAEDDAGLMPQSTRIQGMSINFSRSAAQQAALDTLLAAQQDRTSPLYHQWLTPDQFAAQFGAAASDLQAVQNWLTSQGFSVDAVSRGLNRITFTGTEAQVEAAFGAQLHYFTVGTERHFAPASNLSLPASLAGAVQSVGNISDFQPHSHIRRSASPAFTSGQSGNHFLTPKDVATIYDINPAYSAGYTGAGQSIAIVGQSAVLLSDVANFKTAAGVSSPAPIPVLYPGSGASTLKTGDESESDLDLEYSGTIAPGATVYFVYTGSNTNYGAFDALVYAVINDIAPIISSSYGECEVNLGNANYAYYNQYLQQAAAQGQTVLSASGDEGSTDCYGETTTAATEIALAVDFPGSSAWVTSVGGTEISASNNTTTSSTYWSSNGSTDVLSSALSYIPELAWNDDSTSQVSSGGGGVSVLTTRPSWQAGTIGGVAIPAGTMRLVPDVSLMASPAEPGYLYCSSDSASTGVQGSCSNNGFRDGNNTNLTVAGGTSFAAPIFAGMMALINQATKSTGQGALGYILYPLASNSTTYAAAFHDIVVGNNACTTSPATLSCASSGLTNYVTTTGYDEATGLGSVDLYKLLSAWPVPSATTSSLRSSTVALSAASSAPRVAVADAVTITVAAGTSTSGVVPTGTVSLVITDATSTTTSNTNPVYTNATTNVSVTLAGGTASYSFVGSAAGQYAVVAKYSGDGTYAPSTSTLLLQVGLTGGFNLSVPNTTVTNGSTASSTVTVTPVNGYVGTVAFSVSASPTITNACYVLGNAAVAGTAAATATLSIYTSATTCSSTPGAITLFQNGTKAQVVSSGSVDQAMSPASHPIPFALSFAGLLAVGIAGRRSRKVRSLVAILLLAVLGLSLSACSGASTPATTTVTPTTNVAKGPYTIIVHGTDTVTNTTTNYASFTLTVQ